MKTQVVHQVRFALIACLIVFGLPGISYAQGSGPDWATSVAYSPDGDAVASGVLTKRFVFGMWRPYTPHHARRAYGFGLGCGVFTGWKHAGQWEFRPHGSSLGRDDG